MLNFLKFSSTNWFINSFTYYSNILKNIVSVIRDFINSKNYVIELYSDSDNWNIYI